jgi:hypothetical protein
MGHVAHPSGAVGRCHHADGHGAGGHGVMHHTDCTCAAEGTGTTYTPPVPARSLPGAARGTTLPARPAAPEAAERSPPSPDLSRLQLLRI